MPAWPASSADAGAPSTSSASASTAASRTTPGSCGDCAAAAAHDGAADARLPACVAAKQSPSSGDVVLVVGEVDEVVVGLVVGVGPVVAVGPVVEVVVTAGQWQAPVQVAPPLP